MPSTTTRRRLLAVGGLFAASALGGCSQALPTGSDDGTRRLVLTLTPLDGSLRERYVKNLTETHPPWDEAAFDAALAGENFTTQGHSPFLTREDEPAYARRNGSYYHLDSLVVGDRTVERPVLRLYTVEDGGDRPESVPRSALPAGDRRAVQIAYMAARARGNVGGVPWGLVERGGYVYRDEEAMAASELLAESGPSHVAYRNAVYEVRITRETFYEAVYRPNIDPVADSDAEMESILRAALLDARMSRETLSAAEREILRKATRDSYGETHPYSDAFESVLRRLDERAYIDGNVRKDAGEITRQGLQYLRYDDRYYRFVLQFVTEG